MQGHQNTKEARKRLQAYKQKLGNNFRDVLSLSCIASQCSILQSDLGGLLFYAIQHPAPYLCLSLSNLTASL